jgi:guanylate kinase
LSQTDQIHGKVIIFSAPSGAGKTTIVHALLKEIPELSFSISACSRLPRQNETDGKDYFFIGLEKFKKKIEQKEFVEWEEVYKDHYYGTLKSELSRIWSNSKTVVFDVDVQGGINLKEKFNNSALSVFVMPPSVEVLEQRLRMRKTETEEKIKQRIEKAEAEMKLSNKFDVVIKNDSLENAIDEAQKLIRNFISQ